MIAAWMLYAVLVSALLALVGLAVERLLRLYGWPTRWVWVGAVVGSLVLPVVARYVPDPEPVGSVGAGRLGAVPLLAEPIVLLAEVPRAEPALDRVLGGLWLLGSAALLFAVARSVVALRRGWREWRPKLVGERLVLVSRDVGPAVVGWSSGVVVVPGWVLALDAALRDYLLAHEEEHLRAGDHRLLPLGLLALVAMPWNPVLWWKVRRLRLAVEVDCDARVLRGRPDVGTYAGLLLEVAERRSGLRPLPLAAFSEPASFLERRILAMTARKPAHRRLRALAYGAAAAAGLVAACELPFEYEPSGVLARSDARLGGTFPALLDTLVARRLPSAETLQADRGEPEQGARGEGGGPAFTPYTMEPVLQNREEVATALARAYPRRLREAGIGGSVVIWFNIDERGEVRQVQIKHGSGIAELDAAALEVARVMRFSPALYYDTPVPVWIQIPIVFRTQSSP
ncbi:MAG TPA: M56 family metallopeptidase [Longimicrobiales bacterium]